MAAYWYVYTHGHLYVLPNSSNANYMYIHTICVCVCGCVYMCVHRSMHMIVHVHEHVCVVHYSPVLAHSSAASTPQKTRSGGSAQSAPPTGNQAATFVPVTPGQAEGGEGAQYVSEGEASSAVSCACAYVLCIIHECLHTI